MFETSSIPYVPRDPRAGTLYPLVQQCWPRFVAALEEGDGKLPDFVRSTFERFLACGIPERGFVRLACADCGLQRALPMSCKRRGVCPSCGARRKEEVARHLVERVLPHVGVRQYVLSPPAELVGLLAARPEVMSALIRIFDRCVFDAIARRVRRTDDERPKSGAVVLVQRFTKELRLFPHIHALVLDGGYVRDEDDVPIFLDDAGPSAQDIALLEDAVHRHMLRWLERHGYVDASDPMSGNLDAWFGPAENDVSNLPRSTRPRRDVQRFQIHAAVRVAASDRSALERLCAYVARPPISDEQLRWLDDERVELTLRNPQRGPTTTLVLHPLQLIRRLAWQVPHPRQHGVRYAGVLAPASPLRADVVPAGRVAIQGVWFGARRFEPSGPVVYRTPWAQLLARTYGVDGHRCPACAGVLRPVGAVLPPRAATWIDRGRIVRLEPTGPPRPSDQLELPLAS